MLADLPLHEHHSYNAFNDPCHTDLIEDDRLCGNWRHGRKLQSTYTHDSQWDPCCPVGRLQAELICSALPPEMPAGQSWTALKSHVWYVHCKRTHTTYRLFASVVSCNSWAKSPVVHKSGSRLARQCNLLWYKWLNSVHMFNNTTQNSNWIVTWKHILEIYKS